MKKKDQIDHKVFSAVSEKWQGLIHANHNHNNINLIGKEFPLPIHLLALLCTRSV